MRTSGTFQEVYEAAKKMSNDDGYSACPMDPVIRRKGEVWMLESKFNSRNNADIEIDLDTFDTYFYGQYSSADYSPDDYDVSEFVALCLEWKDEGTT